MPHWKLLTDRDFLGACDLQGRDVTVTISRVEQGTLARAGSSKKERKPVLSFQGKDKRFVLNNTNGKTLETLYGSDYSQWIGKRVTLYPTTTRFGKDTVDCIRIRPKAPGAAVRDTPNAPEHDAPEVHAELTGREPGEDAAAVADETIPT